MQIHLHTIYTRFLVCLISVFMITAISAQSVEKLVTFHTKTNTYLYPLNVKKLNNSVYSIYDFDNSDTLFFQNQEIDIHLEKTIEMFY